MRTLRALTVLALGCSLSCVGTASMGGLDGGGGGGSAGGSAGGEATGGGSGAGGGDSGGGGGAGSVDLDHPLTPGDPGAADVVLEVHSNAGRHAISPFIYGTNQPASSGQVPYGLLRLGGNRLTAYNWENNASNAGNDAQFQNDGYLVQSLPSAQRDVPGAAVTARLDAARTLGAAALVTVPIIDYVAADKNADGDVRNTGAGYLTTRFKQNKPVKGAAFSASPDPSDAFVYQDEFIAWLRGHSAGVQVLVSLDNEPDLWNDTHAETHPVAVTYVELVTRSIDFSKAVKAAWPGVPVTGFVSYGWNGYVNLQNATDAAGKGEFIDYFLTQLAAASATAGTRLVDYLDLHWYPEAKGTGTARIIGTDTSAASVAARVQAPRSLWDPTYTETSWVASYLGEPIRLIPRMRAKIAADWPGTKLAFTEWNYGAGAHISGAVAVADVLGVFGREAVELATYWKLNGAEPFADAAFQAFRNYDGAGHLFGDTALEATTSAVATATIYASVDAANPGRTVLVVINKDSAAKVAGLKLGHPVKYGRLKVWTLTSAGATLTAGPDVLAAADNAFRYTMPGLSVSVLVPAP